MLLMDEPELYARKALRSSPGQLSMFTGLEHTGTAADFREDLHPRDDEGRFRPKGVAKPGQGPTVEESPTGQRKRTVKSSAGQLPLPLGDDDVAEAKRLIQQMRGEAGPRPPLAEGEKPFTLKSGKPEPVKPTGNTVQKPLFGERKPAEMPVNPPAGKATQKPLFGEDKPAAPDIAAKAPDATPAQGDGKKPWEGWSPEDMAIRPMGTHNPLWYDGHKTSSGMTMHVEAKPDGTYQAWKSFDATPDAKMHVSAGKDAEMTMNNIWRGGVGVGPGTPQMEELIRRGMEKGNPAAPQSPSETTEQPAKPYDERRKDYAAQVLAAVKERLAAGERVLVPIYGKPMVIDQRHADMLKTGGASIYIKSGNSWADIGPDAIASWGKKFGVEKPEMTDEELNALDFGPQGPTDPFTDEELAAAGVTREPEAAPEPPKTTPADPEFSLSTKPKHTPAKIEGMGRAKQVDLFAGRGDSPGQTSFFDDIDPAAKNVGAMEKKSPEQAAEAVKAGQPTNESKRHAWSTEHTDRASDILAGMETNQARMREDKKVREGERLARWVKAFEGSPREVTAAKDLFRRDFEKSRQNGVSDDRLFEIIEHGQANGMFSQQEASDLKKRIKPSVAAEGQTDQPKAKEPWEMNRDEWATVKGKALANDVQKTTRDQGGVGGLDPAGLGYHYDHVAAAIAAGKPVPPEVLAEYPDLAKKPADPLTPTERSALPETLKDVNPAFPSEVERLKGIAAGGDFQIAGMSLEKAAKLAAENGHPEAMEKIRSRPSAWKDVLEQWRDAKKSSAAQKSRDTRAANWKPNEIQQGVLDKVGSGGRNFPRSQDMLMWGQNKAATQQLIDRGLLERTDNGREVSYRLFNPTTNAVATPQAEWNPHAELIERAKKYAEYGENYDRNIATALNDLVSVKERGHGQAMQDRMADILKKRLEHWAEPAAGGVDTDALAKSAVESGENAWTHVKAAGHDPIKDWTPAQRKSFMASLEKHREAAQPEPPQPSEGRARAMAAQKERDEAGTNVKHSPAMQQAIKQASEKLGIDSKPEAPAPRPLDDKIASSGGLIAKIGKQMGVKPQDMEDFISDVQLKAIQGQGGYDASKGEFSTWLGTIARNHKMTQQTRASAAKRAGVTQSLATPNESGKGSLADTVAARETARESGDAIDLEKIRGVMGQLPDKQRQAFEAVVTGGKSVTEAAEEMGISKQAVSAYINLAKVKIKAAVGVEEETPAESPPEPQKPAQTLAEKVAAQRAAGKKAAPPKAKQKPKTMVSMSGGNYELVKQNDDGTVTVKNDQGDEFDSEPGEDFTVNGPEPSKRASTQPATPEPPAKSGPPGVSDNDIPFQVAYNAHAGMSHVPEKRAKQRQAEYVAQMTADWEHMSKLADSPEKKEVLAAEFERYRNGFKDKTLAVLHAGSRVMSPMITGPARFPTASNRKRGDAYDKRISELLDFRKRAMAAIQKKLSPESGPVKSSDSNAVETLQKQLDAAQKYQEAAKEVNKIVRSHVASAERDGGPVTFKPGKTRESAIEAIKALGLSEKTASEALKGDYMGRVGIPDYSLKNNNANMRRIKQRIEELSKMKATPAKSEEYSGGVEVHEDPEAARIRIKFPGKPERDAIDKLKRAGFRWSPTEGAWQRHLNNAGRYAVNDVLKSLGHTKQEAAAPQSSPVDDDVPEMLPMSDDDAPESPQQEFDPANHIKIAADDIASLRRQDVYRVLNAAPEGRLNSLVAWINKNRPDLSGEVHDAVIDINEERSK